MTFWKKNHQAQEINFNSLNSDSFYSFTLWKLILSRNVFKSIHYRSFRTQAFFLKEILSLIIVIAIFFKKKNLALTQVIDFENINEEQF